MKTLVRLLAPILFVAVGTLAHAATIVWTNAAGGIWSTASNWNPNSVPAAGDTAVITNSGSYTVTVNAPVTSPASRSVAAAAHRRSPTARRSR